MADGLCCHSEIPPVRSPWLKDQHDHAHVQFHNPAFVVVPDTLTLSDLPLQRQISGKDAELKISVSSAC